MKFETFNINTFKLIFLFFYMSTNYSLENFVKDMESIGWYKSKSAPSWKDELDLPAGKEDLTPTLNYRSDEHAIPYIMDYSIKNEGIRFSIEYIGDRVGSGVVNNSQDLMAYMRVAGLTKIRT